MTRIASSAASTGSASPVGAAVAMLPPRVAGVADLRGPGGACGSGQRGDQSGEIRPSHPRVGEPGAEQGVPVLVLPAADLVDPAQAHQRGGPQQPGVDGGHEVGAHAATGTAAGMAASAATASSSEALQRHGLRRLRPLR